jgi:hypothetical protein
MPRRNITAEVIIKELDRFPKMFYLHAEWRTGTNETSARAGELHKRIIAAAPYPSALEGLKSRIELMTRNDFKDLMIKLKHWVRSDAAEARYGYLYSIWTKPHLDILETP